MKYKLDNFVDIDLIKNFQMFRVCVLLWFSCVLPNMFLTYSRYVMSLSFVAISFFSL